MQLGAMIKRARQAKKMSQRDLAQAVSVSLRTVTSWEAGSAHPRNRIPVLEQILGVTLDDDSRDDEAGEMTSSPVDLTNVPDAQLLNEVARRMSTGREQEPAATFRPELVREAARKRRTPPNS